MLRLGGGTYNDLAKWRAATGLDGNSRTGSPMYVNPAQGVTGFAVAAGSPAANTGLNLLSVVKDDYRKTLRPLGGLIDIGAFER